jgi:hypothetical protein
MVGVRGVVVARRNSVNTVKLQLTVDETTGRILCEMVELGIHGTTKAEVGSWVIRTWIWENQVQLGTNGISLKKTTDEKIDD